MKYYAAIKSERFGATFNAYGRQDAGAELSAHDRCYKQRHRLSRDGKSQQEGATRLGFIEKMRRGITEARRVERDPD
jgi:hypothetical protein